MGCGGGVCVLLWFDLSIMESANSWKNPIRFRLNIDRSLNSFSKKTANWVEFECVFLSVCVCVYLFVQPFIPRYPRQTPGNVYLPRFTQLFAYYTPNFASFSTLSLVYWCTYSTLKEHWVIKRRRRESIKTTFNERLNSI